MKKKFNQNKIDQFDLLTQKHKLEKRPNIQTYLKWYNLSSVEKINLEKQWIEYFKKVKLTKAYKRHRIMKDLFEKKRYKDVILWSKKAGDQIDNQDFELPEPKLECQAFFNHNQDILQYKSILIKMKATKEEIKEQEEVQELFGIKN